MLFGVFHVKITNSLLIPAPTTDIALERASWRSCLRPPFLPSHSLSAFPRRLPLHHSMEAALLRVLSNLYMLNASISPHSHLPYIPTSFSTLPLESFFYCFTPISHLSFHLLFLSPRFYWFPIPDSYIFAVNRAPPFLSWFTLSICS